MDFSQKWKDVKDGIQGQFPIILVDWVEFSVPVTEKNRKGKRILNFLKQQVGKILLTVLEIAIFFVERLKQTQLCHPL